MVPVPNRFDAPKAGGAAEVGVALPLPKRLDGVGAAAKELWVEKSDLLGIEIAAFAGGSAKKEGAEVGVVVGPVVVEGLGAKKEGTVGAGAGREVAAVGAGGAKGAEGVGFAPKEEKDVAADTAGVGAGGAGVGAKRGIEGTLGGSICQVRVVRINLERSQRGPTNKLTGALKLAILLSTFFNSFTSISAFFCPVFSTVVSSPPSITLALLLLSLSSIAFCSSSTNRLVLA